MSLMTSGVKMCDRPRTFLREGPSSMWCRSSSLSRSVSQDELAFARLEVVVVPELLAADELAERGGRVKAVDAELAVEELGVAGVQLRLDAVDAERLDRAADIDGPVVHRVAEAGAGVAADDLAAALQHEAGQQAGVAADDDGAALLVDAGAGTDVAAHHQVAAAQGRARQGTGVLVDQHHAGHHVLRHRPADPAGDLHLRAVDQADTEVAEAALEADPAALQDADADRVFGPRVADHHVVDALLVDEPAQLQVDLAGAHLGGVEDRAPALPVDLGDPRDRRGRLGEPAGVVGDPPFSGTAAGPAARRGYSVHTSTSLS